MKKPQFQKMLLLAGILLLTAQLKVSAQQNAQLINDYLKQEQEKNGWLQSDFNDWYQSDYYFDETSGLIYAYVNQRYHNIIVFNAVSVFAIKNNKVVHFTPDLVDHLENKINSDKAVVSPEDAIRFALKNINGKELSTARLISKDDASNSFTFDVPDFSDREVKVQLVYLPMASSVLLAWNVSIAMRNSSDWWNVRIDALSGNFMEKNNFTVECNFDGNTKAGHDHLEMSDLEMLQPAPAPFPSPAPQPMPPPPAGPVYNVFPFPYEAPSFGSRQLLINPADPVASPFGWHDVNGVAGAEYTITNGNNVYAATDVDANNVPEYSPDGGSNLEFNYVFTQVTLPDNNRDASVTNLFYANNKLHDVLYHLGFNEAAGNFQMNNYGNGGLGNDQVNADAFDGSGTNNANFGTPADGSAPRMQMYLWNSVSPSRDASFDNGIIAHEYGHGLSNRLTGGPANSNCLNNVEQGGEGWSDWLALMMTINPGDAGTDSRGIGTYALGQSITSIGIRRVPYSTSMRIDPLDYDNLGSSGTSPYGIARSTSVHNIGEIWCSALWDMSWLLMNQYGFNSDYTNPSSGNYIAMRLVIQGMKLQPCSPGFLDARNGILNADTLLYGGANSCLIWQAFARRGMGFDAVQGSSNSATDQAEGYLLHPSCVTTPLAAFSSNVTSLACGNAVNFTDLSQRAYTYLWNFGDATTSTLANPSHTYAAPGTYTVTLSVTNPAGSNNVSHTIVATQNPVSAFSIIDASVNAGDNVVFINQSTEACSYFMNFGDNSTASVFTSNHTYANPGDYNVKLVVTNPSGSDSVTHVVHVDTLHINAAFTPDDYQINCGYSVSFTNTSVQSTSWLWDFGDMTTSTLQNPTHAYPFPGTYNVKLTAFNNFETDTSTRTITVLAAYTASATATPTSICSGAPVQLNATNSASSNLQYALSSISYSPVAGSGTAVTLTDDQLSAFLNIGFTFGYAGANYTQFKICSNGYITFNNAASTSSFGVAIPNAASPNNFIALAKSDLNPANAGSLINYFTTGLLPNRKLVVNISTSYFDNASKPAIVQAILYETSNVIELHVDTISTAFATVMGIENTGGTAGVTIPGRNPGLFTANNEGWRFTPATFSYNWMPGNLNGAAQTVFPSSTGSYTVTVSDGSGCMITATTPSVSVSTVAPSISGTLSFCAGGSTILDAGAGYSSYSWSTGATTQTISVNTANTFTVTVTNSNGCSGSDSKTTTIAACCNITLSGTTTPATCNAGSNGSINVSSSNISGSPSYLWNNGSTSEDRTGLTTGSYTVTVSYGNGCTGSQTFFIGQPAALAINGVKTDIACKGINTGSITLSPAGNTSPYTYLWNNGSTVQNRTSLAPGTYIVTVNDANLCGAVTESFTITQPATSLLINTNKTNIRCNGMLTGIIIVSPAGGISPYSYSWNTIPVKTTSSLSGLAAGVYTCTVTDANGCTKTSVTAITEPPAITATQTQTNVTFPGGNNGAAAVTPSGGTPGYSYIWNTVPAQTTASVSGLIAGIYKLTIKDSKDCPLKITFTITEPASRSIDEGLKSPFNCIVNPNPSNGILMVTLTGIGYDEAADLLVYDLTGRLVYNFSSTWNSDESKIYDLSSLSKGIYYLHCRIASGNAIQRIVIQ